MTDYVGVASVQLSGGETLTASKALQVVGAVAEPTYVGVDYSTVPDNSPDYCPTYFGDWGYQRAYRAAHPKTIAGVNPNVKIIGVSDNPGWNVQGGQATADEIVDMCIDFWETGTGAAARQNIGLDIAIQNETDNKFQSGSLPPAMVTTQRLTYEGVHQLKANGQRRFPLADLGLDMTTYQLRMNGSGARYADMVPFIDALYGSYYPIHRDDDPVTVWGEYGLYCDIFFQTMQQWRAIKPSLRKMAVWEVGSPIDHNQRTGGPNNGGTTDWKARPAYFAGGTDGDGRVWEGFYQYNRRKAQEINAWMRGMCYWNRQDNPIIPNPFKHDRAQAPNDLATRWHSLAP